MDPDETTTTTVADPNEETGAGKPVLETPPAEPPDETVTISKAELQRLRSVAGSAAKRAEQDALLQSIADRADEARREAKMARRLAEMNARDVDPEERQKQLAQLTTEERQAQEAADVQRRITGFANRANRKLERAGIAETDSRVTQALEYFQQASRARTTDQAETLLEKAEAVIDGAFEEAMDAKEKTANAKAEALDKELKTYKDKARQAERESAADMSTGPAMGGGGSDSLEALLEWDSRGRSVKELQEHEKRLDAALRRGR